MTRWLVGFAAAWTLSGVALIFAPAGSVPWWDFVWVLSLLLVGYAGIASAQGIGPARVAAGVGLLGFSIVLAVGAVTGLPTGPVRFTAHAGAKIGGLLPVLVPVMAFALLALAVRVAWVVAPGAGRFGTAGLAAGFFTVTLTNGLGFLSGQRFWWLWNPWGNPVGPWVLAVALLSFAVVAFALALAFPAFTELRRRQWLDPALVLVGLNMLFAVYWLRGDS